MEPVGGESAQEYRRFGEVEVGPASPTYAAWACGIADDPEILRLIDTLPDAKRQPNLVLAAARWHGATGDYASLRATLLDAWEPIRETVLTRSTQTNEPGRCAVLLPVLGLLPGPLALIEVGASGGLCLYPDRYGYAYSDGVSLPGSPVLPCAVTGPVPERRRPQVAWRAGLDLEPVDVRDADSRAWLENLVWPGQDDRRDRLAQAIAVASADPPLLVRGDLNEGLEALLERVPAGTTPVVLHSAVLAYLDDAARSAFEERIRSLGVHWISNEGPRVVPSVTATAGRPVPPAEFVVGLDGRAVAFANGHGRSLTWLGEAR